MVLALSLPVHCLTFVSDFRLLAHYEWPLLHQDPEASLHPLCRYFKALSPNRKETIILPLVAFSQPCHSFLQASSAPSNPQPMRMWFTTPAHHRLLTLQPQAVP